MKKQPMLAEGRVFMVIGYNAWGKGKSVALATKNWRCNTFAVGKKVEVHLYDAPEKAFVNEMGQITRPKDTTAAVSLGTLKLKT